MTTDKKAAIEVLDANIRFAEENDGHVILRLKDAERIRQALTATEYLTTTKKETKMEIDKLTIGEAKELAAMFGNQQAKTCAGKHPMLGKRCLIRTYSAGVHIGDVVFIDGMEVKLENSLRLWKWEGGGLSLSAIANNGIVKGRLNKTGEVYLTNVIEFIPTTKEAEKTFAKFIED